MKITVILLIVSFLHVSARTMAQKVTYTQRQASLTQIIKQIRLQTGYNVLAYAENVAAIKPQDVDFKNTPLNQVMDKILAGQPLTYQVEDKNVLIKEKDKTILDKISEMFSRDSILYKGKIYDEKGKPLAGATVVLKGKKTGYIANQDGNFECYGTTKDIMVISYVGYQTQEVALSTLKPNGENSVKMALAENKLNEVIVSTGYQTLNKERAPGSFEQIDNKLFNRITSADVLTRLHDVVPGLYFGNTGTTVRGISSLSALIGVDNGGPLIVLDNIAYAGDINSINPNGVRRDLIRPAKRPCKATLQVANKQGV